MNDGLLGGVEAGGTKMVCAVAHEPGEVLDEVRFPTTSPGETLERVREYFDAMQGQFGGLAGIGYGTFGPAVVSEDDERYGRILPTPKPGWEGTDVVGFLREAFPGVEVGFDTDVNVAALGEGFAGAARGLRNFVYVTVGTGIGGGVVVEGKPLRARPHAEIGHMLVPFQDGEIEGFCGVCSFHGSCLEGLASGAALHARWGCRAQELEAGHPAWDLEARYLAAMVQNLVACFAPERIVLGGGVMEQGFLLEMVKERCRESMAGYWQWGDDFLVTPKLGNQAGITGALLLADRLV